MEGLSFLLKRFFYSLLSGCIINFYIILYYLILEKTINFPSFINFDFIISVIKKNKNIVFIITAIFMSIMIEGICQMRAVTRMSSYREIYHLNHKKMLVKKKYKVKPTITWVCRRYFNIDDNPMKTFIEDLYNKNKICLLIEKDGIYQAVKLCANVIKRENRMADINHYRDHSYILQILRMSFFFIIAVTLLTIIIYLFIIFKNNNYCKYFLISNITILILSLLINISIKYMSISYAKRYVRELGWAYEALRFDLAINKIFNSDNKQEE